MKPIIERWIDFESAESTIAKPVVVNFPVFRIGSYQEGGIPEGHCAGYARRVANMVFGRNYEAPEGFREAWNLQYFYRNFRVISFQDLLRLHRRELFVPGDLVAFFNPGSDYNELQRDIRGRKVEYTHIAVFMGEDISNFLRFGQQIIDERDILTDREMARRKIVPRAIIKDELLIVKRSLQ